MKKLIALLSVSAFLSFGAFAQTAKSTSAQESKKEVTEVKDDASKTKAASRSCCMKANSACCKNNKEAKNCTPEQKAACAKAGIECSGDHAKGSKECNHDHAKVDESKSKTEKAE